MHAAARRMAWSVASLNHIFAHPTVKRIALSVVATHVAANVVDYYITKCAAKPVEQLRNLVTQYALGIRRLEDDETKERAAAGHDDAAKVDPKLRAKRVALRLQFAANRSSWVSSTECALFIKTEQTRWASHNEVPLFLSRPLFQISECKRVLSAAPTFLTRAASVDTMSADMTSTKATTTAAPRLAGASQSAATPAALGTPRPLQNIGNMCFANALLQCCRQLVARMPSDQLPASADAHWQRRCSPRTLHHSGAAGASPLSPAARRM